MRGHSLLIKYFILEAHNTESMIFKEKKSLLLELHFIVRSPIKIALYVEDWNETCYTKTTTEFPHSAHYLKKTFLNFQRICTVNMCYWCVPQYYTSVIKTKTYDQEGKVKTTERVTASFHTETGDDENSPAKPIYRVAGKWLLLTSNGNYQYSNSKQSIPVCFEVSCRDTCDKLLSQLDYSLFTSWWNKNENFKVISPYVQTFFGHSIGTGPKNQRDPRDWLFQRTESISTAHTYLMNRNKCSNMIG